MQLLNSFFRILPFVIHTLTHSLSPYLQGFPKFEDLRIHDGNELCKTLKMNDISMNCGNGNEICSCSSQDPSRYQFEDGGIDQGLLMEKNFSVTESNNAPTENAIEVIKAYSYFCFHAM